MSDQRPEYIPPSSKAVEKFAHDVCAKLVEQGHSAFAKPEIASGFADYLNLIARLTAKYLNAGHNELLENHSK